MEQQQSLPEVEQHKIPTGTLKHLSIEDIQTDERYRKDFGDLEALAESIREKGVLQPITVSKNLKLLAGERRLRAAKLAGLTKIPALVRLTDGEIDAREVELYENVFRQDFAWHERDALIAEIDRLYKEKDINWSGRKTAQLLNKSVTDVARSIKMAKAVELLPELKEKGTAAEAQKVVAKLEEDAITHEMHKRQVDKLKALDGPVMPGAPVVTDLQQTIARMLRMAESNYKVGDVFQGLSDLRTTGAVHLIECDPPYGINLKDKKAGAKDNIEADVLNAYQDVPPEQYKEFLDRLAKELYRVAGRDCWLVFWFGPTWHTEVRDALKGAGWKVDDIPGIWVKPAGQTLAVEHYLARSYEPFFMASKGSPVMVKRGRRNVFDYSGTAAKEKYHTTQRPLPMMEDLLGTFTMPNSIVLCPFLGSGTTIRAAYNLGMSCFGWDVSDAYKKKFMLAVEEDTRKLWKQELEEEVVQPLEGDVEDEELDNLQE